MSAPHTGHFLSRPVSAWAWENILSNGSPDALGSLGTRPTKQSPEAMGRRLLEIAVYDKCCRIGGTLTLDDLTSNEVGDWKMPDFKDACAYAASQGWLIVENDTLTLTTAGLAVA